MARVEIEGLDEISDQMNKLGRNTRSFVRRVVLAGANEDIRIMAQHTRAASHVLTGAMMESIGKGKYKEFLGGGEINVYPLGTDSKGVSNAMKAFVINYGRGAKTKKMGDKFLTGARPKREATTAVTEVMRKEADLAFREMIDE